MHQNPTPDPDLAGPDNEENIRHGYQKSGRLCICFFDNEYFQRLWI